MRRVIAEGFTERSVVRLPDLTAFVKTANLVTFSKIGPKFYYSTAVTAAI